MTIVVCVRHPDHANTFETFDGSVTIFDIDLGRSVDVTSHVGDDEWAEFVEEHRQVADALRDEGHDDAADYIEQVIADNEPDDG